MATQRKVIADSDALSIDHFDQQISRETNLRISREVNEHPIVANSGIWRFSRYLPLITLDFISIIVVLVATYEMVNSKLLLGADITGIKYPDPLTFYGSLVIMLLTLFVVNDLYQHRVIKTRVEQLFNLIKSFVIVDLVVIVVAFFFFNDSISDGFKEFLIWFTVLGILITCFGRFIYRWLIQRNTWLSTTKPAKNIMIIGAGQAGKLYAAYLKHKYGNVQLRFFDDDPEKVGNKIFNFSVVGKPEDILYNVGKADEICVVINNITKRRLLQIIQMAKNTSLPVKVLSSHYNLMFTGMYDRTDSLLKPIPIKNTNDRRFDLRLKRLMDIGLALIGLTILMIPGLIISALVKLNSKGPVFHSSFRVGKDGNLFRMYKFRSMKVVKHNIHVQAAVERLKNGQHMGKVTNDPRITSIGAFLRKYSLDELPQLLNVLKGDMSMVGPRPCFKYEMELFEDWHHQRFSMKPGITGLWQITGRQMGELQLNDAMTTDVYYTNNYFFWIDFRILFRTIPVVIGGKGC